MMNFCCNDCYGTLWSAAVKEDQLHPIRTYILTLTCQDCRGTIEFHINTLPEGHILSEGNV